MKPALHTFSYCIDFLAEQVADVSAADMLKQPNGIANHPAWVIGHLTFSCQLLGEVIGLEPWLSKDFGGRFGPGSTPVADASQYEPKDAALDRLRDAHRRLAAAVSQLPDPRLDEAFPEPSLRKVFPTVRHALTHVMTAHAAYHIGQVNLWRQAMSLPKLGRRFE